MGRATNECREPLIELCDRLGRDPLLVQGAGGNVSWKDEDTLFVKASGTWLSEAAQKEIFVPVDLRHMQASIAAGQFDVTPQVRGTSSLRPSIETSFHALLPHRVVVHLHSVEAIARSIRETWADELRVALGQSVAWATVPYRKPGADLARAVAEVVQQQSNVDVLFLQNHGIVVGADTPAAVEALLQQVLDRVRIQPHADESAIVQSEVLAPMEALGYAPIADDQLHALAQDPDLAALVKRAWAISPDHVVFLGPEAVFVSSAAEVKDHPLDLVFLEGVGVFITAAFTQAKAQQLRCYYEVMTRQDQETQIRSLATSEVHELLNWEAETYRMQLSK